MRILAISGSLRVASSNTALLQNLASAMVLPAEVHLFEGLGNLPPFNPDLDESAPDSVTSFRAMVAAADAVAISSPEYAHGVPGVLKNALDWLVGSGELYHKPVVLLHRSTRGEYAQAALREILLTMGGEIVFDAVVDSSESKAPPVTVVGLSQTTDIDSAVTAMCARIAEHAAKAIE